MPARDSRGRFVSGSGTNRITDTDHGYSKLFERLKGAVSDITVGIHEEDGNLPHDGTADSPTIAQVATWLEVGTSRAPRRSFVADWFDENDSRNRQLLSTLSKGVISGSLESIRKAAELFGEKMKFSMVRRMGDGIPPPNAPSTIKRKKSSTPGVDTGVLRQHVDYRVK